ncbi:hypothetical protein Tco_0467712 [Tanacetum coccineum]
MCVHEFSMVQGELLSLAVSVGFERGLSVDRTKEELAGVLSKISRFVPGVHGRLAKAYSLVVTTDYPYMNKVYDHADHPLSVILQLEPEKLAHRKNDEWINAMVDTPDNEIVDGAGNDKSGEVFVKGISHVIPGSERVSSDPNDVVVDLFTEEKDSGSFPSSSVAEEVVGAPSRV